MQIELSDLVKMYNRMETFESRNAKLERKNEALEARLAELESRVGKLEEKGSMPANRPPFPVDDVEGKYKKLAEYLYDKWERTMELTYKQVEDILGFPLPLTARKIPQSYWANTKTHSYAKGSWLAVGYKAKVVGENRVRFERNLY